ncbi:MAG TPA: hypothetical protein VFI68_09575 [Anaerolineales bacterium]|nr:hypothetical protein [Anaerolineales bacterium]
MERMFFSCRLRLTATLFILILAVIQGCNPQPVNVNVLQGINLVPGQTLTLGTPIQFILNGVGICNSVKADWGDGNIDPLINGGPGVPVDLAGTDPSAVATRTLTHTFTGWGGGKTVTVEGNYNCIGKVNLRFEIPPLKKNLGWAQPGPAGTNMCQTFTPSLPNMIPRMLVDVSATLVGNARGIDFGCFAGGCVGDADGRPGPVADSRFPFPGFREYSVVYRIGSQLIQGGTNTQFTTTSSGIMEFCLNDGDINLTNNKGGFDVTIRVDQLGP